MDLFNKKKVSKLEEEIKLLRKELEVKNSLLNMPKDTSYEEHIKSENEKMMKWILDLIEHNGYQLPERVPYFKMVSRIETQPYMDPMRNRPLIEERYMIPAIEISKIK